MKTVEITYRYQARDTRAQPRPQDVAAARRRLDEGNRCFAELLQDMASGSGVIRRTISLDAHDLGLVAVGGQAPPQRPFAAVLGCSDARVPVELIFNEGPNDLFVVRVAGTGVAGEVLGTLRYALDHLADSLRLVVVLGHSGCGAVAAAVDVFLDPTRYLHLATAYSLRSILDRLMIVAQVSASKLVRTYGRDIVHHPAYRRALIETAVVTNAALAAHTVQREIGTARPTSLKAVYGVYLLETRQIWSATASGLADPPSDTDAFVEFGDVVVRSPRIAGMFGVKLPQR